MIFSIASLLLSIVECQGRGYPWNKASVQYFYQPRFRQERGCLSSRVCVSVCSHFLWTKYVYLQNLWTDVDEISWRGGAWPRDQLTRFWWRSGFFRGYRIIFAGHQHSLLCTALYLLRSGYPSVCLSVTRWHWVKTMQAMITKSSPSDSPRTLVLAIKSSSRNSKGFAPSEGIQWEWSRKNSQFSANKSPYLRNGAR